MSAPTKYQAEAASKVTAGHVLQCASPNNTCDAIQENNVSHSGHKTSYCLAKEALKRGNR